MLKLRVTYRDKSYLEIRDTIRGWLTHEYNGDDPDPIVTVYYSSDDLLTMLLTDFSSGDVVSVDNIEE